MQVKGFTGIYEPGYLKMDHDEIYGMMQKVWSCTCVGVSRCFCVYIFVKHDKAGIHHKIRCAKILT